MIHFLIRRIGAILLISLAIIFFCALGVRMMVNSHRRTADYNVARLLPEAAQDTSSYLRSLFTGRLGHVRLGSGRRQVATPVGAVVADTYVKSVGLLLVSTILAAVLGILGGALAAYWERSALSLVLLTATLLGVSLPTFFTALSLQVIEITWYRHTDVRLVPVAGFGWDAHMILPALVLAARPMAHIARIACVSLSETAQEDFVRTAHAKGLSRRQVWSSHVAPNAAVSILAALGVSVRFALGSLPVVEYFFGWPGLGATLLDAVLMRHTYLVVTLALTLGLTFMIINLLLELAYRALDPRLRGISQVSLVGSE